MDLNFSSWDVVILAVAAYISIATLVRLMRQRRDQVVNRLQIQVVAEQKRQRIAARRAKQIEQHKKSQPLSNPVSSKVGRNPSLGG